MVPYAADIESETGLTVVDAVYAATAMALCASQAAA
jgi:hypothetical protein